MSTSDLFVDSRHFVRWEHGWAEQIAQSRKPVPAQFARVLDEIAKLRADVERERMRAIACGSVARADTPGSLDATLGLIFDDYRSESLDAVASVVRELIGVRADLAVEKKACDTIRAVLRPSALRCLPGSAPMVALDWCRSHDERRAIIKSVKS